jgi:aquaporin Z
MHVIRELAAAKAKRATAALIALLTVLAGTYAMGPISGAAFNPAVVVGLTLLGLSAAGNIWIYLVAQFAAASAAAALFRYVVADSERA